MAAVLTEQGLIDPRTELLRVIIVEKISKSPRRVSVVRALFKLLTASLRPGFFVCKEGPLTFVDSEPEPDIAVATLLG